VVGDSSGAGVGADHQEEALLGRVVAPLARARRVEWRLEAKTGATTRGTLEHLQRAEPGDFDVAVTALGVNDVISGVRREEWLADQRRLRDLLRARYGVRLTVVSGFPPVHAFPALPQPLRWYLGRRCSELNAEHRLIVDAEAGAHFLPLDFVDDAAAMADDGFHPGPKVYRAWGRAVAEVVEASLETAH
jgi:lysophospholipase L1-like esterase